MPIRKILVPTDFSEHGRAAVEMACDLARHYEAEITLLHVIQIPTFTLPEGFVLPPSKVVAELFDRIGQELERERARVAALGLRVEAQTREGIPHVEILQAARDGRFDLVAMGTHGRTGLRHAIIGSVAERVVRKAPCPVLTVRGLAPSEPMHTISES